MKYQVISARTRPHIFGLGSCWCALQVCECCGGEGHVLVDLAMDDQPRMSVFSEQLSASV